MNAATRAHLKQMISDERRRRVLEADRHVRCLECGDELENPTPNQLYCRKLCANRVWERSGYAIKKRANWRCAGCGTDDPDNDTTGCINCKWRRSKRRRTLRQLQKREAA